VHARLIMVGAFNAPSTPGLIRSQLAEAMWSRVVEAGRGC
jgi:hypothetical protein